MSTQQNKLSVTSKNINCLTQDTRANEYVRVACGIFGEGK